MERFVSVALRHTEPVTQTLGIGHIHVRHNGIHLPTFLFFLLIFRIEDDADGKQVVYSFERTFLLLHLLIDGVDGLGASLHVELQSGILQFLLNRLDESGNVSVTGSLRFVQLILDMIIYILLHVFQGEVFQFRLQFVETQFVSEWSIQISGFVRHLLACVVVRRILDLTHQVHTVGNHNQDDTHIFGKRKQKVAEVLRFDGRTLGIELVDFHQSLDDARHIFAKFFFYEIE